MWLLGNIYLQQTATRKRGFPARGGIVVGQGVNLPFSGELKRNRSLRFRERKRTQRSQRQPHAVALEPHRGEVSG